MRASLSKALGFAGACLVAVAALAGCADGKAAEPTGRPSNSSGLAGPTAAPTAPGTAEGSPDALLACLAGEGIPASVRELADGARALVFEPTKWVVNRDQGGQVTISYVQGVEALAPAEESAYLEGDGPVLVLDGEDFTEAYAACLGQAGYTDDTPAPAGSASADAGQVAQVGEATDEWAACARDKGEIAVEVVPAGTDHPLAEAVIPVTLTMDQLNALLNVCPPFDQAAFAEAKAAWAAGDTAHPAPAFPNITVSPGDGTEAGESARAALLDRINEAQGNALAAD
ncbi:MAG: hypothetical protein LBC97_10025 [Bifidobacteriaceae bacterium]|jgi:hypothetical protein|nr:hypothetical protein [Bifidobacteriaceae bacterium]